ncbi:MAG: class I SAM-dependent methyltransferase [archaeon]|nr:class I SAM-dependent methyltransferase [archaeon]
MQKTVQKTNTTKAIFSNIYRANLWENHESVSGIGSTIKNTKMTRQELPAVINKYNIRSLLDMPCGDFNWMKKTRLDIDMYIVGDIVPEIITENKNRYNSKNIKFIILDMIKDNLPKADLILCRDCLIHFSFKDIVSTMRNFKKSGSKYLLTTTFTERSENRDIVTGGWHTINLEMPPFSFPRLLKLINEKCREKNSRYSDKSLGLYRLKDITL